MPPLAAHAPPRAVMVCPAFPLPEISGGRKRAARLLEAMERQGLEIHVLTLDAGEPEGLNAARERGWHVHRFPPPNGTVRSRLGQHVRRLPTPQHPAMAALLRTLATGAAFTQFEEIWTAQYALSTPPGVPVVVSLYNVDSRAQSTGQRSLSARYHIRRMASMERRSIRRGDVTLCVSEADRTYFEQAGASRALLVPNGVDELLFDIAVQPPPTSTALFFGQLSYRPNVEGLIRFLERGWPTVLAGNPDARLRVVGPSPHDELVDAVRRTPAADLVGRVDDIGAELAAARVVLAPIRSGGGTRIKVLEALAAGRPVVGTALGVEGIGFRHAVHGLVAEEDEELAEAVVAVIGNDLLANDLARAGRDLARNFAWSLVTATVEPHYARWAAAATRSHLRSARP